MLARPQLSPLPPPARGRGQGEGAAEPVCGVTHLNPPVAPRRAPPAPPEGRRGAVVPGLETRHGPSAQPSAISNWRGAWLIGSQPVSVMIAVSPSDMLNPVSLLSRIMCRKNTMFGASTCGSPA